MSDAGPSPSESRGTLAALASFLVGCSIIGLIANGVSNPNDELAESSVELLILASILAVVLGLVGLAQVKYQPEPSRAARVMAALGLIVGLFGFALVLVAAALVKTNPD